MDTQYIIKDSARKHGISDEDMRGGVIIMTSQRRQPQGKKYTPTQTERELLNLQVAEGFYDEGNKDLEYKPKTEKGKNLYAIAIEEHRNKKGNYETV
jgi:hypothetical protein